MTQDVTVKPLHHPQNTTPYLNQAIPTQIENFKSQGMKMPLRIRVPRLNEIYRKWTNHNVKQNHIPFQSQELISVLTFLKRNICYQVKFP